MKILMKMKKVNKKEKRKDVKREQKLSKSKNDLIFVL